MKRFWIFQTTTYCAAGQQLNKILFCAVVVATVWHSPIARAENPTTSAASIQRLRITEIQGPGEYRVIGRLMTVDAGLLRRIEAATVNPPEDHFLTRHGSTYEIAAASYPDRSVARQNFALPEPFIGPPALLEASLVVLEYRIEDSTPVTVLNFFVEREHGGYKLYARYLKVPPEPIVDGCSAAIVSAIFGLQ